MVKISVIIPTFNEEKNIESCLMALSKQSFPRNEYEIIVVDAPSKDKTQEIAKQYADQVIEQKTKGNVGGARNDGIEISKGEIILLTDADTIVPGNWIEKIHKKFRNSEISAVCGNIDPLEKDSKIKPYISLINVGSAVAAAVTYPIMRGNNCAFRKKCFNEIGGYSDKKIMDDYEFGVKLINANKRIHFDPFLKVSASVRRMEKGGVLNHTLTYAKEMFNFFFRNKVDGTGFSQQTYD